jgi:metal-sulfur cluster biosynthetic enzyme
MEGAPSHLDEGVVLDGLRDVYDPCCREKGISVVDMGLVRSIHVGEDGTRVELMLTTGWCPFAVDLVGAVQARLREVTGEDDPQVDVRWDEAWTSDRLSDDARRKLRFLPPPRLVRDRQEAIASIAAPPPPVPEQEEVSRRDR